jgi:thiosulfate/3-mercaptopyruvate sulfurtransferase
MELQYRAFLIDKKLIGTDPHFTEGCAFCHKGKEKAASKSQAHAGLVKKPSSDHKVCGNCHDEAPGTYKNSLHFTMAGQRHGVSGRLSKAELKLFDKKVFQQSCRSCHASCGDCHVSSPSVGGVRLGFIKNHKFVAKDEARTCAICHGGRVYPEFTGEFGGAADIHYQKGMTCLDCHPKAGFHGSSGKYQSRKEVRDKPACLNCHKPGEEKTEKAKSSHTQHKDRVSCYGCHSGGEYRNCYSCHLGTGAKSKSGFFLGLNPRDQKTITTLRHVPAARDTFKKVGIKMEGYDKLPNFWDASPHNIKKRTERTRSCDSCHVEKKEFITKETLPKDGSKANEKIIYTPKLIK